MKSKNTTLVLLASILLFSCSQQQPQLQPALQPSSVEIGEFKSIASQERTIEVTGSADMEIVPDEIELEIVLQEYYAEEFEPGKDRDDYETFISLDLIEDQFRDVLSSARIDEEQITITSITTNWYLYSRDQRSKYYYIKFKNYDALDALVFACKMNGVRQMTIKNKKHEKLHSYREEVKTEALKAAKMKAGYLLEGLDKELGEIISIREVSYNSAGRWFSSQDITSNASVSSRQSDEGHNPRSIKLRYEIVAVFEIK